MSEAFAARNATVTLSLERKCDCTRRMSALPKLTGFLERAESVRPLGYGTYLAAYPGGRLATLKFPGDRDAVRGVRGDVDGFSRASRRRLLELLHTVERDAPLPLFVTLTFPDLFPTMEQARAALRAWCKRVSRMSPEASVIWRLETVDRKSGASKGQVAPHFHLMVWGEGLTGEALSKAWFEACGESDYAHLKHGCDVQQIEAWRGVVSYVGKYMAKDAEHECKGRVWGIHARKNLPRAKVEIRRVPVTVAFKVRRTIRRLMHARGRRGKTAWASSVFIESPNAIWKLADFFGAPPHPLKNEPSTPSET